MPFSIFGNNSSINGGENKQATTVANDAVAMQQFAATAGQGGQSTINNTSNTTATLEYKSVISSKGLFLGLLVVCFVMKQVLLITHSRHSADFNTNTTKANYNSSPPFHNNNNNNNSASILSAVNAATSVSNYSSTTSSTSYHSLQASFSGSFSSPLSSSLKRQMIISDDDDDNNGIGSLAQHDAMQSDRTSQYKPKYRSINDQGGGAVPFPSTSPFNSREQMMKRARSSSSVVERPSSNEGINSISPFASPNTSLSRIIKPLITTPQTNSTHITTTINTGISNSSGPSSPILSRTAKERSFSNLANNNDSVANLEAFSLLNLMSGNNNNNNNNNISKETMTTTKLGSNTNLGTVRASVSSNSSPHTSPSNSNHDISNNNNNSSDNNGPASQRLPSGGGSNEHLAGVKLTYRALPSSPLVKKDGGGGGAYTTFSSKSPVGVVADAARISTGSSNSPNQTRARSSTAPSSSSGNLFTPRTSHGLPSYVTGSTAAASPPSSSNVGLNEKQQIVANGPPVVKQYTPSSTDGMPVYTLVSTSNTGFPSNNNNSNTMIKSSSSTSMNPNNLSSPATNVGKSSHFISTGAPYTTTFSSPGPSNYSPQSTSNGSQGVLYSFGSGALTATLSPSSPTTSLASDGGGGGKVMDRDGNMVDRDVFCDICVRGFQSR